MELIIASYAITFFLAISTLCAAMWALFRYAGERSDCKEFPCKCDQCKTKKAYISSISGRNLTIAIHALSLCMLIFTAIFAVSLYIGRTTITDEFDPYSTLNISRTSSPRKISLAYNRLSKSNDKIISKEDVEKAYNILENDVYLCLYSFGSIDGLRLSLFNVHISCEFFRIVSMFIQNPITIVLLVLLGLMTVILCISTRKLRVMSREALSYSSSNVYKKCTTRDNYSTEDILAVLSASREFEPLINEDLGEDSEYRKLVNALSRKPFTIINDDWIHRSNSLIYFHLSRLHQTMSERMIKSSNRISAQFLKVVENYCFHSKSLIHTLKALKVSQCVSQATWNDKPLLQLPHFTEEMVDECVSKYGVFDPIDILKLEKNVGSKLFDELGLAPEQVRDILHVENNVFTIIPSVTYDLANPVNCSSEVTLKIKVSLTKICEDSGVSNPDFRFEPCYDDDEVKARKSSNSNKSTKKFRMNVSNICKYKMDKFSSSKMLSHTPYIMEQNCEKWWFVLGDIESNTLLAVENGELPQTPKDAPLKIKTKFKAPAEPGIYNFTLFVICDTYIGRDIKLSVPVTVDTITVDNYD